MTIDSAATLAIGDRDPELSKQLDEALTAFNAAATGVSDQGSFSVKVIDNDGELVGGLTAWTWGGLCGIAMLWVREDCRKDGWGSKILRAAETEALRRGCDRVAVSSFTFQAPGFYQRHGYEETGRMLGIPGGHEDVHMFKSLAGSSEDK
ncbi:GNAT family N-acetyltransferase [Streptosporangium amethystogenes]|uniref:GNAT family N-acetyltransferase n=1 Tax=Streptosporangium amethystogenes TaxID=2002 RepID=UPI0037BDC87F